MRCGIAGGRIPTTATQCSCPVRTRTATTPTRWGLNPPVRLTQAGLESSDPEIIVCFSFEWFDPKTGYAPNGLHYVELASVWQQLGGRQLPANPYPPPVGPNPPVPPTPPTPPTPPVPPTPSGDGFTGTLVYKDGKLIQVVPGSSGSTEGDLKSAGVNPLIIADIMQLIADLAAKKDIAVIIADVLKILIDLKSQKSEPSEDDVPSGRREEPAPWAMAA